MSDLNHNLFEEMLNDYLPEEKKSGDIINGIITRKDMDFAYLDLSGKQEGRILIREVEDYNVGDSIEVKVLRNDEEYVIVSKFLLDKAKEFSSYEVDEIVTGTVLKKIKGGYSVRVGKNEAFLPFSLASLDRDKDYTGEKFRFLIKEKGRNNLTVSRTDLVRKEELDYFNSINVGDVVDGKVKEVLDFGVILELGPTTGFIHISEVSWDQVSDLIEKFGINDIVKAKIIEKDDEKRKIKLSLKQLEEDPWIKFKNTYNIGDTVKAIVKEILDFGLVVEAKIISIDDEKKNVKLSVKQLLENPCDSVKEKYSIGDVLERPVSEVFEFGLLIELEKDVEGLLHVSDLSYRRISNLSSKYHAGENIKFKIIDFNNEKNRLSLSAKALLDDVWEKIDDIYNIGDVIKGKVINVQDYGIFLGIQEGLEVFIHKNEFSWDRNEHIEYNIGDEIEFKIININKAEKKIGGSIKQLTVSPWKEAAEKYHKGNKVTVPISSIQENFVLVKLTDRFDGMIPKKELAEEFLKDISEKFSVGDEVEAIVTELNEKKKSIVLSVRKIKEMEEDKEMEELMKKYGV